MLVLVVGCDQQQAEPKASAPDSSAQLNAYDAGGAALSRGDYITAAKLYRKSAENDKGAIHAVFAAANLGRMYLEGKGVPQDYVEAEKWIRKAAEQGSGRAQFNLAIMYNNGQGVPQDYVQAYKWVNLAAATSDQEERDNAASFRNVVASRMTVAQIDDAQRLSRDWKRKCWDGSVAPEGGLC